MSVPVAMADAARPAIGAPQIRESLARWLCGAAAAGKAEIGHLERLSGGAIQENWALDVTLHGGPQAGRHAWVLRTDAASALAASLNRDQEYAVLRAVHAAGVKAPAPLWRCADHAVAGRAFFVMERLKGVAAGHRLTREDGLVPDGAALARELGANLARLHGIAPPLPELAFLAPCKSNPALAAVAQYRAYLDTLDTAFPALEWGLRWCELHAQASTRMALLHRDYRTGNYMVDDGSLSGVLDWEFAGWGDPCEDLGWFTARCWRFHRTDREAGGIGALDDFLAGYADLAGWRPDRRQLRYWQVMAHLRWAVIGLQQQQRHLSGQERSLELALTGRMVAELEFEILQLTKEQHD